MSHDRFQALTDEQLDRIDAACSDLEESWKRGEAASIEQQLAGADSGVRPLLLRELLAAEIEVRRSCGEHPHPAEYAVRFPGHVEQIQQAFGFAGDGGSTVELTMTAIYDGNALTKLSGRADDQSAFISVDGLPQQFGRYRLVRLLGRGGMGSVYLAHDQELDRDVAIKFPEFDNRPEFNAVERFRREARAMAALHHPHLCPVYDVGQFDGRHYLTMAFVEGQTLSDSRLSQAKAVRIVSGVARALQSAHEAGVVHRDLKPANVMINTRGEPIVMDFGLASRQAASEAGLTQSGLIVGSPAYMAPEQVEANNELIGPRTDVYALGVILYQLLTGRRPYDGAGMSVLGQISSGRKPLPPSTLAAVDPRLEVICLKAMEHRIEDRYQSAAELAAALDDYRISVEQAARLLPRQSGVDRSCETISGEPPELRKSRRPLRTTAVGIAALVLLALLVPVIKNTLTSPAPETINKSPIAEASGQSQSIEVAVEKSPLVDADYEWSEPVNLGAGANSQWEDDHPTVSADGLTLVFKRQPAQLWQSTRDDVAQPFGAAVKLFEGTSSFPEWCPCLSRDGLTLWFHSTRPIAENRDDQNIWVTRRRSRTEPFDPPQPLGPEINTPNAEGNAFVSADGLTLLFTRGIPEQIFQATRQSESDDFSNARLLNAGFDGAWNGFPRLSADGRALLFVSNLTGHGIWLATRDSVDAQFGRPTQLDATINAGEISGPFLSADEKTLYFSSTRAGGMGQRDLWSSTRIKKGTRAVVPPISDAPQPPGIAADAAEGNRALRVSPGVHVEMPSLKLDPVAPLTIEAWVTPQSKVLDNQHVFGWFGPFSLFLHREYLSWTFSLDHTGGYQHLFDPQPITAGRRVHVAIVRTGKEMRLFVDGQRVASQPEHESPIQDPSRPFSLSADRNPFTGNYDEVRVSRVARYDENFTPQTRVEPDAETLGLYHCDENGGDQLLDASGNQHHGKITGTAQWIAAVNVSANAAAR